MDMNQTVAQITTDDYRTAVVFKRFGIDFCCGGKKSVRQACEEKQVSIKELEKALEESTQNLISEYDYKDWEIGFLADHILNIHHSYVRKTIPSISQFLDKVVRKHTVRHAELPKVQELFNKVVEELESHMKHEEEIVFPAIKQLDESKKDNSPPPHFGSLENRISQLEKDHVIVGDLFKEMKHITNNLVPPVDACKTYNIVYSMLLEFETNLHRHIHLENNILFPKSMKLLEKN